MGDWPKGFCKGRGGHGSLTKPQVHCFVMLKEHPDLLLASELFNFLLTSFNVYTLEKNKY